MPINFFATFVATLAFYTFGAVYYTALGNIWVKALETTKEKMSQNLRWGGFLGPFIISFVMLFVMNFVLWNSIASVKDPNLTPIGGCIFGFFAWLGFVLPTIIMQYSYGNRTKTLAFIDCMYMLIGLLLSSAILVAMR